VCIDIDPEPAPPEQFVVAIAERPAHAARTCTPQDAERALSACLQRLAVCDALLPPRDAAAFRVSVVVHAQAPPPLWEFVDEVTTPAPAGAAALARDAVRGGAAAAPLVVSSGDSGAVGGSADDARRDGAVPPLRAADSAERSAAVVPMTLGAAAAAAAATSTTAAPALSDPLSQQSVGSGAPAPRVVPLRSADLGGVVLETFVRLAMR
jgi:hypothetical protein